MNAQKRIDELSHPEIVTWLERALHGQEALPRLTPDESFHLGILRLDKELRPPTRDSLRVGCLQLLRQFCTDGRGETAYLRELIALASAFNDPGTASLMAQLADKFPQLPEITVEIRLAVLSALADMRPPQTSEFWETVLEQNPEQYAALALSGLLSTYPMRAVQLLPKMPDSERLGQAVALKLDLAWDELKPSERHRFVQEVRVVLQRCCSSLEGPVKRWMEEKESNRVDSAHQSLKNVLSANLGVESEPKYLSPKLWAVPALPMAA